VDINWLASQEGLCCMQFLVCAFACQCRCLKG